MPDWYPSLPNADQDTAQAIQYLFQNLYALRDKSQKNNPKEEKSKESNRSSIKNVAGFSGQLSEPQRGKATAVTKLPPPNSYLSQEGTIIRFEGDLYYYDTSTNPGTWKLVRGLGTILEGTHDDRADFPPEDYNKIIFFETDRSVLYRSNGTDWIYIDGIMRSNIADRPTDLAIPDTNFSFYATDTDRNYFWDGSAWKDVPSAKDANKIFSGPTTGAAAVPTFRSLVAADLPSTAWSSWTPTVTSSSGTTTTNTLEAAYLQEGKKVFFRIYWIGQVSLSSRDVLFTTPVNPRNITNYQTCAVMYQQDSGSFMVVAAAGAQIDDSSNKIIIRSVANFSATTNFRLLIQGAYESV